MEDKIEKIGKYSDTVYNQLNFKTDILDSDKRIFMLIAGVGAGKNHWVKQLTKTDNALEGYSDKGFKVLLITSRATTADAQTIQLGADRTFDFSRLYNNDEWWGDAPPEQKVVCCTNAYIEYYVKTLYEPDNPRTHVWNMFDFIVLDEVHSMSCDATYTDAPFHVMSFLRYAHRNSSKCRIVLMSGTPAPVTWLYMGILNETKVKVIDLYHKCRHLEPRIVRIMPSTTMISNLINILKKGKRVIYFANTTDSMKNLVDALNKNGIPDSDIGISYNDGTGRDKKFSKELVDKKESILDSLKTEEELPSDVRIFITTTKNKEGINIKDIDIKSMVVESHQIDEIRQMVGRVREGLDTLVIVQDSMQHSSDGDMLTYYVSRTCVDDATKALEKYRERLNRNNITYDFDKVVAKIEKIFRYLRYDYFENKFRVYAGRQKGDQRFIKNNDLFNAYVNEWIEYAEDGLYYDTKDLQEWFPISKLILHTVLDLKSAVDELLINKGLLNNIITKEERNSLAEEIRDLVKVCKQPDTNIKDNFSNLGSVLKKLGYSLENAPGVRNGEGFVISKL